jgi:hypothetical protein
MSTVAPQWLRDVQGFGFKVQGSDAVQSLKSLGAGRNLANPGLCYHRTHKQAESSDRIWNLEFEM